MIGGPSASGKTTLARRLARRTAASVVRMDDFYHTQDERDAMGIDSWDDPLALDWKLFHETLEGLLAGREMRVPRFRKSDSSRTWDRARLGDLVLLEGIWALHGRNRLEGDLKVYVEASREERLRRRLKRGREKEGRAEQEVLRMWKEGVVPMEEVHVFPGREKADIRVTEKSFDLSVAEISNLMVEFRSR